MKYLFFWKGMENASFKKTENGYAFFPFGVLGKGYEIDEAKKAEIARFIRTYYTCSTVVVIAGLLFNYLIAFALLVPLFAWYAIVIRRKLGSASKTTISRTYRDTEGAYAATISSSRLTLLLIASPFMTFISGVVLLVGLNSGDQKNSIVGGLGVLLFGFSFIKAIRLGSLKKDDN